MVKQVRLVLQFEKKHVFPLSSCFVLQTCKPKTKITKCYFQDTENCLRKKTRLECIAARRGKKIVTVIYHTVHLFREFASSLLRHTQLDPQALPQSEATARILQLSLSVFVIDYFLRKMRRLEAKRFRPGYTSWYVLLCKEHQLWSHLLQDPRISRRWKNPLFLHIYVMSPHPTAHPLPVSLLQLLLLLYQSDSPVYHSINVMSFHCLDISFLSYNASTYLKK